VRDVDVGARERRWLAGVTVAYLSLALWLFRRAATDGWFDSNDLRGQARLPLFSERFWRGERPPGYPLLLKALGPFSPWLPRLQLALYVLAFIVVAWGLARRCRTAWVRTAAYAIVLFGSLSGGLFEWTHGISTESLSVSLFVLPVGLVLAGATSPNRPRWQRRLAYVVIAASLVEWLMLRDLDAAWLAVAAAASALLAFRLRAPSWVRRDALAAVALAAVALVAVALSSDGGQRWRYPLVNILAHRVLTDPVRLAFFQRHGMPDNPKTRCFAGHWACDCKYDYSGFEPWLTLHGKQTYARDLWRHPRRLFLEPLAHWKALLTGDRYDEPGSATLSYYSLEKTGRLRGLWSRLFLWKWRALRNEAIVLLVLLVWARRRARLALDGDTAPLVVLAATVYPLLVLVWHGDAMEIQRHALVAIVSSRLALWGAYAVAVDRLAQSFSAATAGGNSSATSPSSRSVASSS